MGGSKSKSEAKMHRLYQPRNRAKQAPNHAASGDFAEAKVVALRTTVAAGDQLRGAITPTTPLRRLARRRLFEP
jgi:hypothetical protein